VTETMHIVAVEDSSLSGSSSSAARDWNESCDWDDRDEAALARDDEARLTVETEAYAAERAIAASYAAVRRAHVQAVPRRALMPVRCRTTARRARRSRRVRTARTAAATAPPGPPGPSGPAAETLRTYSRRLSPPDACTYAGTPRVALGFVVPSAVATPRAVHIPRALCTAGPGTCALSLGERWSRAPGR